jgi:hypothetical protein
MLRVHSQGESVLEKGKIMIVVEILVRVALLMALVVALPLVVFGIVEIMKDEEVKLVDNKKSMPMCGDCLIEMHWSYDEKSYVCPRCF